MSVDTGPREVQQALGPLLDRVRGRLVEEGPVLPDDIAVTWPSGAVVHVRLAALSLHGALPALLADIERQAGRQLPLLSRLEKRGVVRYLQDHGAFEMRRSPEVVAEALGISRYTVYNYLNARRPST